MKLEVTGKREEKTGFVFKKPIYLARAEIHLTDEEFEALKSMVTSKQWKMYPLGEMTLTDKIRREVSMDMLYTWAKKTKTFSKGIRTPLPEEREMQIVEVREIASTLKQVLEARLSAMNSSDDDVAIEI